jgi:antitoxin (DNA-binding transcriptional repressor) of toxin-antitoxin stability system
MIKGMSELAIEQTPDVADAAREAAGGQVVYITERGQRVAGIIPADLAATLEGLSADDLEQFAEAAAAVGREDLADFLEDLADRAAVLKSRAAGWPGTPWEQLKAEAGL